MKDYVYMATEAYYHRNGKVAEVKEYYEEAIDRFSMIHVLIGMAYTETLKVIDVIDDRGMRRQMIKKLLIPFEERYNAYKDHLREHMTDEAWGLLWDYVRLANDKASNKINLLRQACYNYLKNNGVAECKLIAQSEVAVLLWQIVVETHTLFFKSYKQLCGVDFSKDFAYADMKTCRDKWLLITEELSKSARGLNFSDNLRCRNAWADLKAEIDRTEFFDDAAAGALNVNPRIYEKYVA